MTHPKPIATLISADPRTAAFRRGEGTRKARRAPRYAAGTGTEPPAALTAGRPAASNPVGGTAQVAGPPLRLRRTLRSRLQVALRTRAARARSDGRAAVPSRRFALSPSPTEPRAPLAASAPALPTHWVSLFLPKVPMPAQVSAPRGRREPDCSGRRGQRGGPAHRPRPASGEALERLERSSRRPWQAQRRSYRQEEVPSYRAAFLRTVGFTRYPEALRCSRAARALTRGSPGGRTCGSRVPRRSPPAWGCCRRAAGGEGPHAPRSCARWLAARRRRRRRAGKGPWRHGLAWKTRRPPAGGSCEGGGCGPDPARFCRRYGTGGWDRGVRCRRAGAELRFLHRQLPV